MKNFALTNEQNGLSKSSEKPYGLWPGHMAKPSTYKVYSAKQNIKNRKWG